MTFSRNEFISLLDKKANFDPDYEIDSADVARKEHETNRKDSASYLKGLFDNAGKVETNQGKQVNQLFPGTKNKETSDALMKLANLDSFFDELAKIR